MPTPQTAGSMFDMYLKDPVSKDTNKFLDYVVAPVYGYDSTGDGYADYNNIGSGFDYGNYWDPGEWDPDFTKLSEAALPIEAHFDEGNVEAAEDQFFQDAGYGVGNDNYGQGPGAGQQFFNWETLAEGQMASVDELMTGVGGPGGGSLGNDMGLSLDTALDALFEGQRKNRQTLGKTTDSKYEQMGLQSGTSGTTMKSGVAMTGLDQTRSQASTGSDIMNQGYMDESDRARNEWDTGMRASLEGYITEIAEEREEWFEQLNTSVSNLPDSFVGTGAGYDTMLPSSPCYGVEVPGGYECNYITGEITYVGFPEGDEEVDPGEDSDQGDEDQDPGSQGDDQGDDYYDEDPWDYDYDGGWS